MVYPYTSGPALVPQQYFYISFNVFNSVPKEHFYLQKNIRSIKYPSFFLNYIVVKITLRCSIFFAVHP